MKALANLSRSLLRSTPGVQRRAAHPYFWLFWVLALRMSNLDPRGDLGDGTLHSVQRAP